MSHLSECALKFPPSQKIVYLETCVFFKFAIWITYRFLQTSWSECRDIWNWLFEGRFQSLIGSRDKTFTNCSYVINCEKYILTYDFIRNEYIHAFFVPLFTLFVESEILCTIQSHIWNTTSDWPIWIVTDMQFAIVKSLHYAHSERFVIIQIDWFFWQYDFCKEIKKQPLRDLHYI